MRVIYIWNITDLAKPVLTGNYNSPVRSIDRNLCVLHVLLASFSSLAFSCLSPRFLPCLFHSHSNPYPYSHLTALAPNARRLWNGWAYESNYGASGSS
ncbi:hypothetical protein C8R45DRAFT_1113634 [Mycena sanguinolenta]|nr:hypothetical protein C8R45DRAFT_1113634 [Mycena sanguinolenta]